MKGVLWKTGVVCLIKQQTFLVSRVDICCASCLPHPRPIHWLLSFILHLCIRTAFLFGLYSFTTTSKPLRTMGLTSRQDDGGFKLYHYDPSMTAAAAFIILFVIVSAVHCWKMFHTRCWIMVPLVIGGLRTLFVCICDTLTCAN